jgi:hypothetical protein
MKNSADLSGYDRLGPFLGNVRHSCAWLKLSDRSVDSFLDSSDPVEQTEVDGLKRGCVVVSGDINPHRTRLVTSATRSRFQAWMGEEWFL